MRRKRKKKNEPVTKNTPPEKKRQRRRKKTVIVICNVLEKGMCWYKGNCPHRTPHKKSQKCETTFCSLMKIKTDCIPVKEDD